MESLTAREVVDMMGGGVGDQDSGDSEIEEDPFFPLPCESSRDDEYSDNEDIGTAFRISAVGIRVRHRLSATIQYRTRL